MTTSISSLPMSDGGALHPLLWNETGLDGAVVDTEIADHFDRIFRIDAAPGRF